MVVRLAYYSGSHGPVIVGRGAAGRGTDRAPISGGRGPVIPTATANPPAVMGLLPLGLPPVDVINLAVTDFTTYGTAGLDLVRIVRPQCFF